MNPGSTKALRRAILDSVPEDPFQVEAPAPQFVYLPHTHVRALDPDNMLVVGARGTGKSFWWHALLSERARAALAPRAPSMQRGALEVCPGWSEQPSADFPDKDTLGALRRGKREARIVWRTILLHQIAPGVILGSESWASRVAWVEKNPEATAAAFREIDSDLSARNARRLILFDALDRTADAWDERRVLLKGLLQLVLDLRSTRALRAKVFVRRDMIDDPEVAAFPDASKVLGTRVELTWPRQELYGLLWQYMGNAANGGDAFRQLARGWSTSAGVETMPDELRASEERQRRVFATIAGTAMGTNERRGLPYTWIPTHLGDATGVATPRSFLAALRVAAANTENNEPNATLPLVWRAIHVGVREASTIRVRELAEDFPWARPAMEALEGLVVPCESGEILTRWRRDNVTEAIERQPEGRVNRRARSGSQGLLDDLADIGVLEVRSDGRYNIPDVYRVGFGLRRRGGVRPVR